MKTPLLRQLLVFQLLLVAAGCNRFDVWQKVALPGDRALATNYIELLRQRRYADIESAADPSIRGELFRDTLVRMAALIPSGAPTSVTLVGATRTNVPAWSTVNLTYEYEFPAKWLVVNVALKTQGHAVTIVGFNLYPEPTSLREHNRFRLAGKTSLHYLVLGLAVIFPLLTLYSLIVCARTSFRGRKWPWIVFVLLGFGKFAVNWTTGQWVFALLSIQLFSASAIARPYGPWTIAVSLPLGAVMFLLLRRELSAPVADR